MNNGVPPESKVLVDTCFLISLVKTDDPLHTNAEEYFRSLLGQGANLYMSAITLSEFQEKQDELEVLANFRVVSFGPREAAAQHAKFPREIVNGAKGEKRASVKDDIKILATCFSKEIPTILSSDDNLLKLAVANGLRTIDFRVPLATYLGQLPLK